MTSGLRNRMSVARCCCVVDPPPCDDCTDYPGDELAVTFAGFGNTGFCYCDFFNSTFILKRGPFSPCMWEVRGSTNCSPYRYGSLSYWIRAYTDPSGVQGGWECFLYVGNCNTIIWTNWTVDHPFDCTETRVLPYRVASSYGCTYTMCSDYATTTCTVN